MNTNCIYFTDLHANEYKQHSLHHDRLEECLQVIDDVYRACKKTGASTVLFGGDLNDIPKLTYTVVMNALMNRFAAWIDKRPGIRWFAISGNHDICNKSYYKEDEAGNIEYAGSMLTAFATAFPDNFFLIDNTGQFIGGDTNVNGLGGVYGIPYYEHKEHYSKALDKAVTYVNGWKEEFPSLSTTLLIHQTPEGIYNSHIKADTDPNDPRYAIFDMVLCGHIHQSQLINKKFLVGGNPLHRDLGDIGNDKGIWSLDLADPSNTLQFISRKGKYPEFKRVRSEAITEEQLKESFIVPDMARKAVEPKEGIASTTFNANLPVADLLTNFWKQVEGQDEKLLKTGLSLING
jgi:DNA repair exonuclease SbcCD nuclease subunit